MSKIQPKVIELNVGGVVYSTTFETLVSRPGSKLSDMFLRKEQNPPIDSKGRYFIDRDGVLFRYVLDFLRNNEIILPEHFFEKERLKHEALFFELTDMFKTLENYSYHSLHDTHPDTLMDSLAITKRSSSQKLPRKFDLSRKSEADIPATKHASFMRKPSEASPKTLASITDGISETEEMMTKLNLGEYGHDSCPGCGYITVSCRGTFASGREGLGDIKFRKITRILVCGRISLCREVFGDSLNQSRDPDRGTGDRYTARFFLKHNYLEQAFDALMVAGFHLSGLTSSGTNAAGEMKVGSDTEETRWQNYSQYLFCRM